MSKVVVTSGYQRILDMALVAQEANRNIYGDIVRVVNDNNLKTVEDFNLFISNETAAWLVLRQQSSVPNNSTFRSALSVVRKALKQGVALLDEAGNTKGKSSVEKECKAAESAEQNGEPSCVPEAFYKMLKAIRMLPQPARDSLLRDIRGLVDRELAA